MTPLLLVPILMSAPADAPVYRFPPDPHVLDAKRDLGAKGDGMADDTDALQKGLDLSSGFNQKTTKVLFLPNGIYRVTRSLVVNNALGPWVYGESREGVVLKLADGATGVTAVLRTHPREKGPTSADWFMRNLRNFTLDAGDNPEADGIRYYATNIGILQNVTVRGNGKVGIHSGFLDQSGPCLVQDCLVDGFETGVASQWMWAQTLSRVTVRNSRKVGLKVEGNVVAAEDLVIENVPEPVRVTIPNDWHWWGGVLALHGGRITGTNPSGPAIFNGSILYARDVTTTGYQSAVGGTAGADLTEFVSHPAKMLFDSPKQGLRLPVKREPVVPWEADPARWECANDHGAVAGDNQDDTAALQKAIDAAAAAGKTVVYLRGCGGGDPNWYTLDGEVKLKAPVRLVTGLGWARVLGGKGGRFVVDEGSAPVVQFRHIDSFGGPPARLEVRHPDRTLVAESCGVSVAATAGDVFVTDCPAHVELAKGAKGWCRQLNPEGDSDDGLVTNAGDLWMLGFKTEGRGVRVATTAGGRTELFGAFVYGPGIQPDDRRPLFDVADGQFSLLGLRELSFAGGMYNAKVRERRGAVTRTLGVGDEHGWIGWAMYSGR